VKTQRSSQRRSIREVVLPGTGTTGFTIVGGLEVLHSRRLLRGVKRWVGGSSGAATALFMSLGYTPTVLYTLLSQVDFSELNDITCDNILECFDTMGLTDGGKVMHIISAALRTKGFNDNTTFCELRGARSNTLVITGYNMCKGQTEAFSADTTPHMPVWMACRISISIPFLFRPVKWNGDVYSDGCTLENTPVRFIKNPSRAVIFKTSTTGAHIANNGSWTHMPLPAPTDLPSFFALFSKRVFHALDRGTMREMECKRTEGNLIVIPVPPSVNNQFAFDFTMDASMKRFLYESGKKATQEWVHHRSVCTTKGTTQEQPAHVVTPLPGKT